MPQVCDSPLSESEIGKVRLKSENGVKVDPQNLSPIPKFRSCSICHTGQARYRCPACSAVTCSCSCVKEHKLQTSCTGVREPVPVVQKEDMDDEMLQRDYRFLESVLSRLEKSLRDPRVHHLDENINPYKRGSEQQRKKREEEESLVFKHRFSQSSINEDAKRKFKAVIPNYGGQRRRRAEVTFHRADVPSAFKKLRYEARERGTQLAFMPRDMSRHSSNTSHYSFKCRAIRWRVRVEFVQANVYFEATFDENISIGRIVSKFLNCHVHELRGWSCSGLRETSHEESLKTDKNAKWNSNTCRREDPLKDYWSEGVPCDSDAKVAPVTSSSGRDDSQTNPHEECKVLKDSLKPNKKEIAASQTSQTKKTSVSFANEDVIKMTLNTVCDSADATHDTPDAPLALDITRAPKINNPKPLSEAQMEQMLVYQAAGIPQLSVLFKNENFYDHRRYVEMCASDSLKESLAGLRVVEHPIFSVFLKDHSYELASVKEDDDTPANDADNANQAQDKTFKYFDADCSDDFMDECLPRNFE